MKKLFSLALVLFAMLFSANAQYLLNEGFEDPNMSLPTGWTVIDNDGDGNNWYVLNNSQSSAGGYNVHSGDGHATSASYNGAALTPDNWLITPQINLTTNSTLTFWVAGQDSAWASEYFSVYVATSPTVAAFTATTAVTSGTATGTMTQYTVDLSSYTGQSVYIAFRHHNVTDMFRLNLDDVQISFVPTAPTIITDVPSINFGTVLLGSSATQQVTVSAYQLTAGITATVTGPYTISADSTTFGTTASIAQTGGTLYVKYAPTAAGTDSGSVTLSSTGATSVNIALTSACIDCSNITIPFTEGFESTIDCWTMVSMDPANDNRFGIYEDAAAYEGSHDFRFSSFSSATDYNQYLITPELTLNASETYSAQFYYKGHNSNENFRVMYSTTTNDVTSFTMLADYTNVATDWTQTAVVLPAGTKYVAINYYGNHQYYLYIDNFSVDVLAAAPTVTIEGPSIAQNGTAVEFTAISPLADTFAWTVDGAAASSTTNTLSYTFNTPGNHTVAVTATNVIGSTTATHTVEVVSCDAESLPFSEDFNSGIVPPICWSSNDAENFGVATVDADAGDYAIYFASPDMLVSPELSSTEPMHVNFGYRNYLGNYGTSTFRVGFSSTDNNASSFTWFPAISINAYPADNVMFFDFNSDLPANTKYVAIDVIELGTYSSYSDAIYIDNFLVDNNVSINEYNNNVSVYPNPANNSVNVNATSNINMVEVFNMMGQRVAAYDANDTNVQINTTALNNGMYMMRITTENGVSNQKLMIAR